ncbi:hypothetical protein [Paenisporosarcina sp. NPDC076907]|uniref:hypothetical protein n=1 Tax=Paenisporosarcina sp. NPDC076907 TaxID=3390604 RepID=UPI003D005182
MKESKFKEIMIDKKAALVTLMLVLFGIFIAFMSIEGQTEEKLNGFKHESVQFEDFTFELMGSNYADNQYTFHFEIVNTSSSSINPSKTFFKIKNDSLVYSSELANIEFGDLNPGMTTSGKVVFKMNKEDLEKGSPIMQIEYGYIFDETIEIELKQ